jgi:inositol-1,3,4-trisphosphate 5/6-kinase/inositol-tetrakisphosphate 1-kinase
MVAATTGTSRSAFNNYNKRPIRLWFVPLDPDFPLDEQHGGRLDLILHELTEDILACSLDDDDDDNNNDKNKSDSYRGVQRLTQCKLDHPECCMLVDDPSHVKTLMSRSDIANVLQSCLQGITSASGMLVQAPKFVVGSRQGSGSSTSSSSSSFATLQQRLVDLDIMFPLIAKPLTAAGTKQSHYMTVLLHYKALETFFLQTKKASQSHLLQEHVNHDATLYKAFVY